MNQDLIVKILIMVFSIFLFVAFLVPFVKKIANHVGALDVPNERKVHTQPMPRLGGLAIYFGYLLGYMLFGENSLTMNAILIGSFIIVLTGVVDDIKPLRASTKFIGQLAAALVVVFYGNILIKDVSAFGFYIDFRSLPFPISDSIDSLCKDIESFDEVDRDKKYNQFFSYIGSFNDGHASERVVKMIFDIK